MGTPTGTIVRRIVGCGRGSDYYGACERCGKNASEMFKLLFGHEYVRENGETYDNAQPVSYGHRECLELEYNVKEEA